MTHLPDTPKDPKDPEEPIDSPDELSSTVPSSDPTHPLHRRLKSFVRRAGRTTDGQARAFAELGPKFLLPYSEEAIDLAAVFGRTAPTVLEIGFGMGEATASIAALMPDTDFLCCEVHEPGVGALLKRIGEQQLTNIRICAHDAVEVLDHMLRPDMLDGVHVFFPDPWHKKRHNKRRLLQSPFVAKLAAHLKPGGYLHCATDWQPYAEQILEVLSREPLLRNTAVDASGYAPKPAYRPLTKFENRGIKLGHGVWDVVFERKAATMPASPLVLRKATAADAALIADIHTRSRATTYRGMLSDAYLDNEMAAESLALWQSRSDELAASAGNVLIAERDGQPLAFVRVLAPDDTGGAYLDSVHAMPDRKGGGAGTALLAAAGRWAKERGATHLHLRVLDGNAASIGFYESRGWQLTDRIKDIMGGQEITALTYALKLDV
jgi:tRNA (guanine-N7-)-methyltransferase